MSPSPALAQYSDAIGQCTYYVASTLDWVGQNWGNAATWLERARSQGYATSSTPVVGSIAVWRPYAGGAQAAGHVAVVTGVQGNGLPTVSEQNWSFGPGRTDTRNVDAGSATGIIGYILPPADHGGPPAASGVSVPSSQSSGPAAAPASSGPGGLTGLLNWITSPSSWWRVAFVAIGVVMVLGGIRLYVGGGMPKMPEVVPV